MEEQRVGLQNIFDFQYWWSSVAEGKYEYASPFYLELLWTIPFLLIAYFILKVIIPGKKLNIAVLDHKIGFDPMALLALIPPVLFSAALTLLLIALARPQRTDEKSETWTEGIDIMLVLDISGSMEYKDLKPNRLEALKEVSRDFVDGRSGDKIGLTVFAGEAFVKTPLTTDYDLLKEQIATISLKDIAAEGTAIGDALGSGVRKMKDSQTNSKVMILISDGDNTAGRTKPDLAAKLAAAYGVKIYTIGLGTKGKIPVETEVNTFFGSKKITQYIENNFNEKELVSIAEIGNGEYFRATNNQSLAKIFDQIDELEKSEIKEERYKTSTDYYHIYLIYGIALLLLWYLTKSTFLTSAIHD